MELMRFLEEPEMDAAGEAFDKVARAIGWDIREDRRLISFQRGDPDAIPFPRAHIEDPHMISASVA